MRLSTGSAALLRNCSKASLSIFFVRARAGKEIFLIIDGYDSFAYEALACGKDAFREAMGDLHGSAGAISDILATAKAHMATGDGAIAKCFIAGVLAIPLGYLL